MPKAGTHLLMKAVGMFDGIRQVEGWITNRLVEKVEIANTQDSDSILIGVDSPKPIPIETLTRTLRRAKRGDFIKAHTRFSEDLANLLEQLRMKTLLILRDPRDVVVSHANFLATRSTHLLFDFYQNLSTSERIMTSIAGLSPDHPDDSMLLNIEERYRSLMPWISHSLNYTTYFEKLVGPKGGGSYDEQIQEIEHISQHLDIRCSQKDIERVADTLFGGTTTFRKGTIGRWRKHFTLEHKQVFKDIAGQVLIDLGYEDNHNW
jgi:hypothetical protein